MKDQAHQLRKLVEDKDKTETEIKQPDSSDNLTKIYAVTSGKGGVGKTNLVVNLSLALQQEGYQVGIIDADLGMANVDVVLGLTPQYNLGHVMRRQQRMEDIIIENAQGIELIPGASGLDSLANLSKEQLEYLIKEWKVLEDRYDIILIDTGAGVSQAVVDFVLAADEVIVVSTPEPTSVTDAYGVIKVLANYKENVKINLVINQTDSQREGKQIADRIRNVVSDFLELEVQVLGSIPYDRSVSKAVKNQQPFILEFTQSQAAESIRRIKNNLLDIKQDSSTKGVKGFFSKLFGLS
ncbi:MAG: MinD/ParA family protein [Bacillota bacterium]